MSQQPPAEKRLELEQAKEWRRPPFPVPPHPPPRPRLAPPTPSAQKLMSSRLLAVQGSSTVLRIAQVLGP